VEGSWVTCWVLAFEVDAVLRDLRAYFFPVELGGDAADAADDGIVRTALSCNRTNDSFGKSARCGCLPCVCDGGALAKGSG
jgi:hypothetical protein